jgi:type VI secretion system protein VasG
VRDEALKQIIRLKLGKIQRRLKENHKIELTYDNVFLDAVASRCTEVESGARNVDHILTNTLLPDLSRKILGSMAEGEKMTAVSVTVGENGDFVYGFAQAAAAGASA